MIADQAHAAFGIKAFAVKGDDAGGFLAAMLEGVEAEGGERCRIGMAVNAEDTAFFPQAVTVDVEIFCHWPVLCPNSGCWVLLPVPSMRLSSPWVSPD